MSWDWLSMMVDGAIFAIIFGFQGVVSLTFGLHAVMIAVGAAQRPPLLRNVPLWLGLMLTLAVAVLNLFMAFAFYIGAAVLSGLGIVIFAPGLVATIIAFIVWGDAGDSA